MCAPQCLTGKIVDVKIVHTNTCILLRIGHHDVTINSTKQFYCGQDQRLKCFFLFPYGAMLYLPNFLKIQHTWENIALLFLPKLMFRHFLAYPAIEQCANH